MSLVRVFQPVLFAVVAGATAAQDWPQWRGPARDGRVPGVLPLSWPKALKAGWKVPVGVGYSSPVVSGRQVFTFARQGGDEVASSFDLDTGKLVWRQAYAAPYAVNPAAASHGPGPKSTPVVQGGRLCTLGIAGTLSCFDAASGRVLWRKDFKGQFRDPAPIYGAAMSPAIADGLVLAHVGGEGDGALTAFDAGSGAVRWAWKGDGPGYASPVVAEVGGVRQVVTQTQKQLVGLSLAAGELLWSLPFTTAYEQNAVTPVVQGDVVIYSGLGRGLHAVRIARQGKGWSTSPVWDTDEVSLYMSSPVLDGGLLFGLSHKNKGQFFCVDAATGQTRWLGPPRQGDNAAVLAGRDVLLLLTSDGEMIVAKKHAAAFSAVATYTVADSATWAHPALVGQALLVKDAETLALWRIE
jgi:outer membrane protein assembly factor BamB